MIISRTKRTFRIDLLFAVTMIVGGLAITGLALARLAGDPGVQLAQATPPLQSTPGAESKPSAPKEPVTTGTPPAEGKPEPAHPEAEAQKAGPPRVPPPPPAEKTAPPIR